MKHHQIKDYMGSFLSEPEPDISNVQNTLQLFNAYVHGLEGKDFPFDDLSKELDIQKVLPEPFHTSALLISVLKNVDNNSKEYINRFVPKTLSNLTKYFKQNA